MKGTLFKKLVAGALALLMVGTALPQGSDLTGIFGGSEITASAETVGGTCGSTANWSFDTETGKLTITGTGEMTTAPWRDSYGAYITSVEIEKGITNINVDAFYCCSRLASVTIPGTVGTIGFYAFSDCDALEQLTISEGVKEICNCAFTSCGNLKQVTIPSSVKNIGDSAFEGCTALEHVTIQEGVETIGENAFKGCSSLVSVTIPSSVVTIGENAFDESTVVELAPLEQLTFPEKTTEIGASSILKPYKYSSIVVPSTVTTIAGNAFRGCTNLTSIYMLCDPSTLSWNFTDGRYILYQDTTVGENRVNVYVPNAYLSEYFLKFGWSTNQIKDATFIPAYNVSVASDIANGSVIADRPLALQGETVTLTVTPDEGYAVKSISVNDGDVALTDNGDGTYSFTMPAGDANVTAEMKPFDVHLYGHSLSLDGDIGVNFYMDLDDSVKNSETAKMIFTVPNGSKTETQELFVKDVLDKTATVDGTTYYQFKCKVSAKDMASDITAQIVDGETKGTKYTYSVREYAKYILDNSNDYSFEIVNLVKAMLNYGSAAQEYFLNESGSDLANYDLDTNYYAVDEVSAGNIDKPYDFDKYDRCLPEGVTFEGVTLSLKSETTLSLYFKSENEMTFVVCANFETSSNYDADVERTGDYWVFRIRGISAAKLDSTIALHFGVPAIDNGGYVDYCPLTYCYNVINRDEGTPQLQKVCKALYLYNQAANSYFG
ncbi:MAG: leucine-rich repeat protein [Ruminococcus sp.]|nr:leucine-rich repeat protein [Ruminococcus sp.]